MNLTTLLSFLSNKVTEIRELDEYGGFRYKLDVRFENMKSAINIDIATGDPITPSTIAYRYTCLLTGEEFTFKSYNLETILAEKLQSILSRGLANSRLKDYYDIYIIFKFKQNEIDVNDLKEAFKRTTEYRKTVFTKDAIESIVCDIESSEVLAKRWDMYSGKMPFARNISYSSIIEVLKDIINYL